MKLAAIANGSPFRRGIALRVNGRLSVGAGGPGRAAQGLTTCQVGTTPTEAAQSVAKFARS